MPKGRMTLLDGNRKLGYKVDSNGVVSVKLPAGLPAGMPIAIKFTPER